MASKQGISSTLHEMHEEPTEVLKRISARASHHVGQHYLEELVRSLSEVLHVDLVFVGALKESGDAVRTITLVDRGDILPNFAYDLADTPCADVINEATCCFTSGIQQKFPRDILLQDMGIESYSGTPLFDSKGEPSGIIVLLGRKPIEDPELVKSIVEIYAGRAAAELERQEYEEQLRQTNASLVSEKARSESARAEAEAANKAKSEFLTSMTHELRTPLNAVLGFAQILESDTTNPLTDAQLGSINHIADAGNHLLALINQVLDLASVEADQLGLSPGQVLACEVLEECIVLTTPAAELRDIRIIGKILEEQRIPLLTDRLRFKQILINFLSNAVKYNRDGGTVTIEWAELENDFLRISVSDTGIGIAEKDHESVFGMFHRLGANATIAVEGSGIGLSVAKDLAERMAGRIGFESKEGVGSTFWLELPLATNEGVIVWDESLRIGVDSIDSDHQAIIALVNRISQQSLDAVEIETALGELVEYARHHFLREEAVMGACGYPDIEAHKKKHRGFVKEMSRLASSWTEEPDLKMQPQLRSFLRDWWLGHIREEDPAIATYAKGQDASIREALESLDLNGST